MSKPITITYTNIKQGLLAGSPIYHIDINAPKLSTDQIAGALFDLRGHGSSVARKLKPDVLITGSKLPTDSTMIGLLKPLRDQHHVIIAEMPADFGYRSWYSMVDHLVIKLTGTKWVPFQVQQLWYTPQTHVEPAIITEPKVPFLYLDLSSFTDSVVVDFFKRSKLIWNVLMPGESMFAEKIHGGK